MRLLASENVLRDTDIAARLALLEDLLLTLQE